MIVSRPPLRYHGGKWILAPWIIEHFPIHKVYTEAFGGGGNVLLRKPRSYAEVYNDLSGEVVNVFRVLRDDNMAARLAEQIALTPFSRDEFLESYEPAFEPVERARRTIIRSLMGFGSDGINSARKTGFRANSNRSGTAPARDWVNYPAAIPMFTERLRGVIIENRDAREIMLQQDAPNCLHYVDPPYVHATRSSDKCYDHEMTDEDHRALASVLHGLKGMVVVSGYPCSLYDELYGSWHMVSRTSLADGARARMECIWLSPAAMANRASASLL